MRNFDCLRYFGLILVLLPLFCQADAFELDSSVVETDAIEQNSSVVDAENIDMFVGEVRVMGKVDVERVAVGNGGIIRAEILSTQELLVIAQLPGSSSLRLWGKDGSQRNYNFRISENDPEKRVRMDSMIRIKVKMVEFRKSALGKLGITWGEEINGPTFATVGDAISSSLYRPAAEGFGDTPLPLNVKPFSSYLGITSAITSRINLLASDGDATILSEPVLSCINGGSAKFLSGGEFPIPVVGNNGQTQVEFKDYGIKLDISPRANKNQEIHTTIKTEVSEIDQSTTVLGVPGILSNKTETIVNVRSGQTIVISGLLKAKNGEDFQRVPGLGNIPLVGGLFRSKETRNEVAELVVFLTPEIVEVNDTIDARANRLSEIWDSKLDGISERLEYSIMD